MADRNVTLSTLGTFAHSIRHKTPDVAELASNLRRVASDPSNKLLINLTFGEHHDATWAASKLEDALNLMLEAATLLDTISQDKTRNLLTGERS